MPDKNGDPIDAPTCFCGSPMALRETKKFTYRKSGAPRKFWGCSRWPSCDGVVGAHPNGAPVGTCADTETKNARIAAHEAFDAMWKSGRMSRASAYKRLAKVMGIPSRDAHIGGFTKEQCETLIARLAEHTEQRHA